MMVRVLHQRRHCRPAGRQYLAIEGSSTRIGPWPWPVSGRKTARNAVALGQLVANDRGCTTPRYTGKTSAITQVVLVNACSRPAGAAAMNRSAA